MARVVHMSQTLYMYREKMNCSKDSVLVGSDVMRGLNVVLTCTA